VKDIQVFWLFVAIFFIWLFLLVTAVWILSTSASVIDAFKPIFDM